MDDGRGQPEMSKLSTRAQQEKCTSEPPWNFENDPGEIKSETRQFGKIYLVNLFFGALEAICDRE